MENQIAIIDLSSKILVLRDQCVMLDADVAEVYAPTMLTKPIASLARDECQLETVFVLAVTEKPRIIIVCAEAPVVAYRHFRTHIQERSKQIGAKSEDGTSVLQIFVSVAFWATIESIDKPKQTIYAKSLFIIKSAKL